MAIFSVYVVNKAGGLIYHLDSYAPRAEAEKTFSYPLDLLLKLHDERVLVAFGQRDGIRVGHAVLAINGKDVNGKYTADGKEVLEYLGNPANYPVSVRFGRPRLTSNEKLMLASMFHSCNVNSSAGRITAVGGLGKHSSLTAVGASPALPPLQIGCSQSAPSCLLNRAAQALRCWRQTHSSCTASRP
ncbi:trafficking protein particle complex subunit 4 isoform X3 [Myotis myotis]|uniref:trafficking protein particle complex subunit 4 isoform X3 n=1 Tax=Myotis myotis TaxID=51298 RepID=UPI00174C656C|nr:trafficking protein particle complex subunit 4 isoform X3 [Myotis myotis]